MKDFSYVFAVSGKYGAVVNDIVLGTAPGKRTPSGASVVDAGLVQWTKRLWFPFHSFPSKISLCDMNYLLCNMVPQSHFFLQITKIILPVL